jgi:hypothetical protein
MKVVFTVVLLAAFLSTAAQSIPKITLGFACYEDGSSTDQVNRVSLLVVKRDYIKIISLLNSTENADRFLSVIVLEKLKELKKIKISKADMNRMLNVRNSDSLVCVCSGCTYFEVLSLRELFLNKGELYDEATFWINDYLGQLLNEFFILGKSET